MKTILLPLLNLIVITSSFGQPLIKEEDYRDNDPGKSQIVRCESDPIFRIEIDKAFETNVFSTMTLTKLKSYLVGYEITDLPKEMTAKAGTSFSVYTWRPGTDDIFPESYKGKTITVIPKVDEALMAERASLKCKSFDIELPFKRDKRPQLSLESERTIRIELDGKRVIKQYDLLGRFPSIDFKVFEDDYDKILDVTLTTPGIGFKMDDKEDGVLNFDYTGAVPQENRFKLEVEAKDTKSQSIKATINVVLVQQNGDIAPVFSSIFNGDREFKYGQELKEGDIPKEKTVRELTLPFKEFGGYNPANNTKFKFTPK
ncbi:MAG: hypothetical protein RIB63_12380, partial [Fulvivirga sp.]